MVLFKLVRLVVGNEFILQLIKAMKKLLLLLTLCLTSLHADEPFTWYTLFGWATGSSVPLWCIPPSAFFNNVTNTIYVCEGHTFKLVSASGGGSLPTTTSILKGDGAGNAVAATAGTDYVKPGTATSYTAGAKQTFLSSATTAGMNWGAYAGNPSSPTAGDTWFNSSTNQYSGYISGATRQFVMDNVTTLPSLASIGTVTTGVWNGTAVDLAHGGTGLTSAADDTVLTSNGSAWQAKAMPNCTDTGGNHLNYTVSSNSFSCGTSGGGSGTPGGSSGDVQCNIAGSFSACNIAQNTSDGSIRTTKGFAAPVATTTFSATPTFDLATANRFQITLTGNITSADASNLVAGQIFTVALIQDGTGGHTVAWAAKFANPCKPSTTASITTTEVFQVQGNGTTIETLSCTTNETGAGIAMPMVSGGVTQVKPTDSASSFTLTLPAATDTLIGRNTTDTLTNKTIDGASNPLSPTSAQTIGGFTGTCDGTTFLRGDGVCGTVGVSPPATGGFRYIPGLPYDGGLHYPVATGGTPNSGLRMHFTVSGTELYKKVFYKIQTAGFSGEGFAFAIYNNAATSPVCITSVGTGSAITTTGVGSLSFSSGSAVSGGVCTLTAGGYYFVQSSNSTTLELNTHQGGFAVGDNTNIAYTTGAVTTGTGAGLTFVTNISGLTWSVSTSAVISMIGLGY